MDNITPQQFKKISLLVFETIFIIIIIFLFSILNKQNYQTLSISNLPQNFSKDTKDAIKSSLLEKILLNTEDIVDIEKNALIREDTFSENDLTTDFIVDIENIKQSYKVSILNDDTNSHGSSITISCLTYEEKDKIIYPDFKCKNFTNSSINALLPSQIPILDNVLKEKIKQRQEIQTNDTVSNVFIYIEQIDNNNLLASSYACSDKEVISQTKSIVDDWIAFHGFNPKDYSVNFKDSCITQN